MVVLMCDTASEEQNVVAGDDSEQTLVIKPYCTRMREKNKASHINVHRIRGVARWNMGAWVQPLGAWGVRTSSFLPKIGRTLQLFT